MASEVSHRHSATGETLYFTIRNTARQMWNTAGTPNFETLSVANWGDYDVALSESPASSYFYVGTFPAISGNMVAGWYWVDVFKQAGASPAISDVLQASYFGYWDGTTYKWWGEDTIAVSGTVQTARDLGLALPSAAPDATNGLAIIGGTNILEVDTVSIDGIIAAAQKLAKSAGTIVIGTVDNTAFSPTATEFECDDITEATTDHFRGRVVLFTSGALIYQKANITDYVLATGRGHFTVEEMTEAPANNDTLVII